MPLSPPNHLVRKKAELIPDNEFEDGELLYRRVSGDDTKSHFSRISTKNFAPGVSTNRSKYSQPFDVLWVTETEDCNFVLKDESVAFCSVAEVSRYLEEANVKVFCNHTPNLCNFSHVDVSFSPDLILYDDNGKPVLNKKGKTTYAPNIDKRIVTTIRLFLASVFKKYEEKT